MKKILIAFFLSCSLFLTWSCKKSQCYQCHDFENLNYWVKGSDTIVIINNWPSELELQSLIDTGYRYKGVKVAWQPFDIIYCNVSIHDLGFPDSCHLVNH